MRVRSLQLDFPVFVSVLSLSFYWAGAISMKYGLFANYELMVIGINPALIQLAGSAGLTLTLLVVGIFPDLMIIRYTRKILQVIPFFASLPQAFLLMFPQLGTPVPIEFILLARVLFTAGIGCVLVQSGLCLSYYPAKYGAVSISISFLAGVLIALSIEQMPAVPGAIICSLFIWAAALFAMLIPFGELLQKENGDKVLGSSRPSALSPSSSPNGTPTDSKAADSKMPKNFFSLSFGLLFYSSLFGIAIVLALKTQIVLGFLLPFSALFLLGGSIVVLLILKFGQRLDLEMIQWFLFVPIIISLIPLLFSNYLLSYVCCAILMISFCCYDISNLIILSGLTRGRNPRTAVRIFSLGRAANGLGFLVGGFIMLIVTDESLVDSQGAFQIVIFFASLFLVAGMAFLGKSAFVKDRSSPEQSTEKKGRWRRACDDLIKTAELSEREQEVFIYLSKGHSSDYISEKLFIAPSTVKTYISRIYQKLDIHSHQELLNAIERQAQSYDRQVVEGHLQEK